MADRLKIGDLYNLGNVYRNLSVPVLYEHALVNGEGVLANDGPLVVKTGKYTGRSPNDKFLVKEKGSEKRIWWSKDNQAMDEATFDALLGRVQAFYNGRNAYVQDCYAGADPNYRLKLRVVTHQAFPSIFAHNMFVQEPSKKELDKFEPEFTVLHAPGFSADPDRDKTNSEAAVVINFKKRIVLICATAYCGEIKKSIFTVMNYLLPLKKVMSMHCSANIGKGGDVALFFGLSGTGKTTLSSDPNRSLIGDDEFGWSPNGVFNFEGGCYAKVIRLSEEAEPQIYATTRRFGTILENVVTDSDSRIIDLDDAKMTENTRASYPIHFIPGAELSGVGGHPKNIVMLTCDAFGVLPPVAKLTPELAMYHFLSGYTAKVAGTERGITEPKETFSACFGAPFMVLPPTVYADLLGAKIKRHKANCWLINTGWTGGPYGTGHRMPIAQTRAMVTAALEGKLDDVEFEADPIFKVLVPKSCPGVDAQLLNPRNTWKDKRAYTAKAKYLAKQFAANFKKYKDYASDAIKAAAPKTK